MRNIFDMSFKSSEWDGACFCVRKIPKELDKEQAALTDQMIELALNRAPRLYRLLNIALLVLMAIGLLFGKEGLSAGNLTVAIPAFAVSGVALVGVILATVTGNRKKLTEEEREEKMKEIDAQIEALNRRALNALGVPADAAVVDILSKIYNPYNKKDSEDFSNGICSLFLENDKLCFADGEGVFAIPLSEITAVVRIKESVTIDNWLKETPHNVAPYDTYGIVMEGDEERYRLPAYCAVRCTHNGEDYQALLPEYDISPVLRLTGFTLTDEK